MAGLSEEDRDYIHDVLENIHRSCGKIIGRAELFLDGGYTRELERVRNDFLSGPSTLEELKRLAAQFDVGPRFHLENILIRWENFLNQSRGTHHQLAVTAQILADVENHERAKRALDKASALEAQVASLLSLPVENYEPELKTQVCDDLYGVCIKIDSHDLLRQTEKNMEMTKSFVEHRSWRRLVSDELLQSTVNKAKKTCLSGLLAYYGKLSFDDTVAAIKADLEKL
jgi:hypothetical protein